MHRDGGDLPSPSGCHEEREIQCFKNYLEIVVLCEGSWFLKIQSEFNQSHHMNKKIIYKLEVCQRLDLAALG